MNVGDVAIQVAGCIDGQDHCLRQDPLLLFGSGLRRGGCSPEQENDQKGVTLTMVEATLEEACDARLATVDC